MTKRLFSCLLFTDRETACPGCTTIGADSGRAVFFCRKTVHFMKKEVILLVTINGEQKDCAGMTVHSLLSSMNLDPKRSAVMIRGKIVPKAEYDRTLSDGDDVDIVGFVGGG